MATRLYGVDVGAPTWDVSEGVGSATTAGIEVTLDLAKVSSKEEALLGLQKIKEHILSGNWPPA